MEILQQGFDLLASFVHVMLNLDVFIGQWVSALGPWMYVLLFAVIFCETGLVVTPFLPGDSLLFAVGAIAAIPESNLSILLLGIVMIIAGVIGDAVNFQIGRYFGPRVFVRDTKLLNRDHLRRTQAFYEKHGGKTIILARFMPIVRTFAPFVAGVGNMEYRRFAVFNVVGAVAWVILFLLAGYFFGNIPVVKRNFHVVILAIILISFAPVALEFIGSWRQRRFTHR